MSDLWQSNDEARWQTALESYGQVVAGQGVERLPELDRWYREALPVLIAARQPVYVTHAELARVAEWKMARGVWRQRNLLLVRSNEVALVEQTSRAALARMPDPTAPIKLLAGRAGVGPATASAVAAAAMPDVYPFFDELVAAQVPALGAVVFTLGYYTRYAAALRERAHRLGNGWTPAAVERALWAYSGGKARVKVDGV